MAIYSLNHKAIGKATQDAPFTASAHIRYISRSSACREIVGHRMPVDPKQAQNWFKVEEAADRKNARVCDKVMIALPRELDAEERLHLVKDFAERVTQGKAPWIAAVHDKGKDRKNPHCHLVFRDRDTQTGKRILHMSAGKSERALLAEKGIDAMTTERMRVIWEHAANEHLERAGHAERIDSRSLKEQNIKRQATVHEGVKVRQMAARGERPHSKVVEFTNAPTARSGGRSVDYSAIDGGTTRQEYNAQLISLSERRAKKIEKNLVDNAKLPDNFEYERNTKKPTASAQPNSANQREQRFISNISGGLHHSSSGEYGERKSKQSPYSRSNDNGIKSNSENGPRIRRNAGKIFGQSESARKATSSSRNGRHMRDEEKLNEYLAQAQNAEEREKMLQDVYRDTYVAETSNAREYDDKKLSREQAEKENEAARNARQRVVSNLEKTDKGREFLAKEAAEVRAEVYARDVEIRAGQAESLKQKQEKSLEEKRVKETNKVVENLPRSAEVVAEEVQQDEGKKKAAEIMAFLAAQEKKQQEQSPISLSDEKERKRERDNEWEPE